MQQQSKQIQILVIFYVPFWKITQRKGMNLLSPPTLVLIEPLLFFNKDGFGMK